MIGHNQITIPERHIKLPYRVRVLRLCSPGWLYYCPACSKNSGWVVEHRHALSYAAGHARRCPKLRALNRKALTCWNCDGAGRVGGDVCLVCLGKQWTAEPDPSKERHA